MDKEEQRLREEYFEGPASDQFSLAQFFIQNGRPDLAEKEKINMPRMKKGGTVKKNKPKSKKSSTLRGVGIARKGVRKAKIR